MPKRHYRVDPPTDATTEQLRAWNDLNRQLTELTEALSNFRVDAGDTLEFTTAGKVYEDLRVPLSAVQTAGVADPDFAAFLGGTFCWLFDKALKQSVLFTVQVPHSYLEGSSMEAHVHWAPIDTTTGTVSWGFEYTWANIGDVFPTPSTMIVRAVSKQKAYGHQMNNIGYVSGRGKTISSMLMCHLYRFASDTYDTYDNDAALLEFDFHYKIDTIGSKYDDEKR